MKKLLVYTFAFSTLFLAACTSAQLGQVLDAVNSTGGSGSLTNQEIVGGLKQALTIGAKNSSSRASAVNGFYGNPALKIPFPPEAVKMENTLRDIGLGGQIDKFVEVMNRGAEESAKKAANIFVNAITSMSISDAVGILKGPENAATEYLKKSTTAQLTKEFRPSVNQALSKVKISEYWTPLTTKYNSIPFVAPVNTDLNAYVTERAISGLFVYVAEEEAKIRKDPAARVTDLLKKVFGSN